MQAELLLGDINNATTLIHPIAGIRFTIGVL